VTPSPATSATRWDRLVEQNRFDCAGMRAVWLRATRELDDAATAVAATMRSRTAGPDRFAEQGQPIEETVGLG
jgi:hypothetical protein